MERPSCARCGMPANVYVSLSGEALCWRCFTEMVERRVERVVRREISPSDKVGIAVSGGKDSLVLLTILGKLRRRGRLKAELHAFTIIEEQPYSCFFRQPRTNLAKEIAEKFDIPYTTHRFSELFGVKAIEIFEALWKRGEGIHACTICGVLRRKAMNMLARRFGWSKIATAHTMDDEAQTVAMNLFMGNPQRIAWFTHEDAEEKGFTPRVKPLRYVREEEIALYAYRHGIPLMEAECPYVYDNPRYSLKFMLAELEKAVPHAKRNAVSFAEYVSNALKRVGTSVVNRCELCGDPTSVGRRICRACEIMQRAGLLEKYLEAIRRFEARGVESVS